MRLCFASLVARRVNHGELVKVLLPLDSHVSAYSASNSVACILTSRGFGPRKMTFKRTYFESSSLRTNLSTRSLEGMAEKIAEMVNDERVIANTGGYPVSEGNLLVSWVESLLESRVAGDVSL